MEIGVLIIIVSVAIGLLIGIYSEKNKPKYPEKIVRLDKPKYRPIQYSNASASNNANLDERIYDSEVIDFKVKGTNFRTNEEIKAARFLEKGDTLVLEREPDNAVDPHAVKVYTIKGVHIGYVQKNLSEFVFDRVNHVNYCRVKSVSNHDIPFIDAEFSVSSTKKKQPDFIPEEYRISAEDKMLSLGTPQYDKVLNSEYGSAVVIVSGIYERQNESISRAKALVQGEKLILKEQDSSMCFPHRIDVYSVNNVCIGYITDRFGSDILSHSKEIIDAFVEIPMCETNYEHFAIRLIMPKAIEKVCNPFGVPGSVISTYDGAFPKLEEAFNIKRTDPGKALEIALPVSEIEKGIEAKFLCCQCYRLLLDYESEEKMIQKIIKRIETVDENFVSPRMYWDMKSKLQTMQKRLNTVQTRLANKAKNKKK